MTDISGAICREFQFGPYRASLLLPDAERIRQAWTTGQAGTADAFPYWSRVWPAAIGLCMYLSQQPGIYRRKRLLEIGAGLGLPALICAQEADFVLCTDLSPEAVAYAQASAARNGLTNMRCKTLDWTKDTGIIPADVLLLSDINYAPESFTAIMALLEAYLGQGTTIVLSTPHRLSAREFIQRINPWIRHRAEIMTGEGDHAQPVSVYLLGQNGQETGL